MPCLLWLPFADTGIFAVANIKRGRPCNDYKVSSRKSHTLIANHIHLFITCIFSYFLLVDLSECSQSSLEVDMKITFMYSL